MAPFGKIYTYPDNPRVRRAQIIAQMNGLELEFPEWEMGKSNKSDEFRAKFPFGKIPAFEGADGFCLAESLAIAFYLAKSGPKADQLLGTDTKTQALINQWATFAETELGGGAFNPLVGMLMIKYIPFTEHRYNTSMATMERCVEYLETSLKGGKKYLVGEQLTMADIAVNGTLIYAFKYLVGAELREKIPNVVAYVTAYVEVPEHKAVYGELEMCEKPLAP